MCSVQEHPLQPWGYCFTYDGLGSLDRTDAKTKVTKTIWDFAGGETTSRHVPKVRFQGRAHPGVIGTAPSHELLAQWTERERQVVEHQRRVHGPAGVGVTLPLSRGAYVGQALDDDLRNEIYTHGARTAPGREHGGNIDIASLTKGSKVFLVSRIPSYATCSNPHSPSLSLEPSFLLATPTFASRMANPRRQSRCLEW